jgi:translocation and assembly module TamA
MFGGVAKNTGQRRAGGFRLGCLWLALAAALLVARGADARTAEISLTVVGDEDMANEIKDFSKDLDKDQPLTGDSLALLQAAQARRTRIAQALRSKGFYDARVTATVNNQPIEDAAALDAIEAMPEAQKVDFVFNVATGPVYKVSDLEIRGPAELIGYPPMDRSKLSIIPGQPADAAKILATEDEILNVVRGKGYALASVSKREVVIDHATREAQVTFVLQPGPVATMGPVHFSGTDKVDTTYLQRRVPYKEGDPYDPDKVNKLRDKLTSLGTFSVVRIKPATALDTNGQLPIDVELQDRPPRTIGFGLGYETILGFSVNGYWQHRNLFGEAESLRLSAEVNRIGYGAIPGDLGYAFKADFKKPDWWLSGQDGLASAVASRDVFPAYTRKGVFLTLGIDRTIDPHWRVKIGLSGEVEEITRYGITNDYSLIGLPMQATLNQANSEVDATQGYRLTLNVTPYADLRNNSNPFAITRLTGTGYLNVSGDGRSVLAGRASFGTIPGGVTSNIPFDKLFYAGGGGSVRGYAYQYAGPRDAFGNPIGGASVVESSIEFRQRIGKSFGVVAFVDAGAAYLDNWPNFSQFAPRVGTGVGVRYYTSFGPARLDFGIPLNPQQNDPPFGIYVSIGQAF